MRAVGLTLVCRSTTSFSHLILSSTILSQVSTWLLVIASPDKKLRWNWPMHSNDNIRLEVADLRPLAWLKGGVLDLTRPRSAICSEWAINELPWVAWCRCERLTFSRSSRV